MLVNRENRSPFVNQNLFVREDQLSDRLAPVALGGEILSYAFARCFHEAYGVRTIVVSAVNVRATSSSRLVDYRITSEMNEGDEAVVAYLGELGRELVAKGKVPLVVGSADWHARILSAHKEELSEWFVVPYNDFVLFDDVTRKDRFYQICEELGIAYPRTLALDCADSGAKLDADSLTYPVVAKPANSALYDLMVFPGKEKVYQVEDADGLRHVFDLVRGAGYEGQLLVQDFIPGDDDALRSLTTFSDADGRVRVVSGGRVVLQDHSPARIGNPMCILPERVEQIIDDAKKFCEHMGYRGYANFDIKYDERDGRYKFFEVNARPGRNTYYVALGGVNIARLLVDEYVLGHTIEYQEAYGDRLYTCVPASVVRRHVANPEVRDAALALYRAHKIGYPYDLRGDAPAHAFWSRIVWLHQIDKFNRYMRPVD